MFYSMRSGGKCQKGKPVTAYTSPVIPEALENLYGSVWWRLLCLCLQKKINFAGVLMICCWLTLQTFGQSEQKKTPQQKGSHKRPGFWRTAQYFKGLHRTINISATRQKKLPSARRRHFCILLLPGKSMAYGGTRTAGFAFSLSKD